MSYHKPRSLFVLLFLTTFLTACAAPAVTPESTAAATATAPEEQATLAPTSTLEPSPTPDLRLPPERWQEWPVTPAVTNAAIEIYWNGIALGNNPQAFSKLGDCQSIRQAFMGIFDLGRYTLAEDEAYLQETIDNFAGYFDTDGQGVRGGFNAAAVLSPLWADPTICLPGETPLECEIRLTHPTFMFISLEVWWDGRTPERYEAYLREIIEFAIAHGVVPILATKADNVEGDNSINLTTAQLAYEYDIPLWNFWAAVQGLPDHGLDPTRPDGFHISTEAWNVRSHTALQALDALWRGVNAAVAESQP